MQRILVTLVLAFVVMAQSGNALVEFVNLGCWPKSWPSQLEELRSQSRTFFHRSATSYEIRFTERAQFEAAWPHILSLATKGTPVILTQRKDAGADVGRKAGVSITTPNTGQRIVPGDKETGIFGRIGSSAIRGDELKTSTGTYLEVGPPWPDEIRNGSGELPEFVVAEGLKWRATTLKELRENGKSQNIVRRARIEISLTVDGKIVDLNRIRLPAFVIDRRFEK